MILIFGHSGQVASALRKELVNFPQKFVSLGQKEVDFLKPASIIEALEKNQPKLVINCAAYTAVDRAETEKEQATAINAKAVDMIAQWCAKNSAKLIHFSTDYVFPGNGLDPWREDDFKAPQNWYGQSKLDGENAILKSGCQHLIFRISWVYSPWGTNFVKTMLRLMSEREELKIVNDQVGAPTSAVEVAKMLKQVIPAWTNKNQDGVYHFTDLAEISWCDFAKEISAQAKQLEFSIKTKNIIPIRSSEFPTPAQRPLNSRMDLSKTKSVWKIVPKDWKLALQDCLKQIQENQ